MTQVAIKFFTVSFWLALSSIAIAQPPRPAPTYADNLKPFLKVNSFESLSALAKSFSAETFQPMPAPPKVLTDLSYEDYQKIQFRYPKGIWWGGKTPFWFETFHRGFIQQGKIEIFTIEDGQTKLVPYDRELFDYAGVLNPDSIPADTGHAGLKIAGRFPRPGDGEELLTFIGSSYFRARPDEFVYGASARALAVNISMNIPEEFPVLRAFWVIKPINHSKTVKVLALLDSPRVTGAYEFSFTPGLFESAVDVKARLHFRAAIEKLALAPITSMWMWGDGFPSPENDNRPGVHDSDGVLIRTKEEGWIWRPLARHSYPSVSSRRVETLMGFGALQRNRAFFHFEDYNANYHKRPSVYVTPKTPWKNGRVEIMEFPAPHEGIDNIGVYWVFDKAVDFEAPMDMAYKVDFLVGDVGHQTDVARATSFTVQRSTDEDSGQSENSKQRPTITLQTRFSGNALETFNHNTMPEMQLKMANGRSISQTVFRTETHDLMASVTFEADGDAPVELEMQLLHDDEPLTETFLYLCPAKQPTIPKE